MQPGGTGSAGAPGICCLGTSGFRVFLYGQHHAIVSARIGGSFPPMLRFETLEIHKVCLRVSNLALTKNLSPKLLAESCGAALANCRLWTAPHDRIFRYILEYHRPDRFSRRSYEMTDCEKQETVVQYQYLWIFIGSTINKIKRVSPWTRKNAFFPVFSRAAI